ncbi:Ubiquinol cytochrome-c reductase complex subunit 7 [Komagataella phaffii CBS 7435]|uniref:Cytochrome b-c1 complex subunit 7 n=2 Tax=Komagataella phaffii TaxID=460519 RepID=C4QWS4_KOMPG|nr:Subunit 7 of the ubiquinol cytochrome-c reductase complex [Komagataella phaffii GS115]AOA60489.1 GQ67_02906T0 [Komagataella phaffii]KAI0464917.1 Cytochrome b-c1 complex subunit 7 [Komagataella kurtzmanii]CAH2446477.1 Ubiquinol cytochrome-c reductase complex subunit 7 [Komagataella phaffii CBS 7435]AOA65727.1 GQ68_02341T0 [Komagataella phaffii GS115]CAY67697.1 Subunit 7 of the ubiquinol cytochrome-c reductase complex [Komagataella phaffii GS115]
MATLTSVVKSCDYILKTPILRKVFLPAAKAFGWASGHREVGLRVDDLLIEETPVMQKAISRLPSEEVYARNFRILTAHQLTLSASLLPKNKFLKAEDDIPYLTPYILEAEAEAAEKAELDNIQLVKN